MADLETIDPAPPRANTRNTQESRDHARENADKLVAACGSDYHEDRMNQPDNGVLSPGCCGGIAAVEPNLEQPII